METTSKCFHLLYLGLTLLLVYLGKYINKCPVEMYGLPLRAQVNFFLLFTST